jgi:hypothetical protein
MIKSIGKLTLATILAAVVVGMPLGALAQDKTTPAPAAPASPDATKPRPIPFRGKIGAVDLVNKTIALDEKTKRTFEITSETKISKAGKPATLADAVVGEDIGGSYTKSPTGKLVAKTVRLSVKAAPVAKEAAPAK